MISIVIPTYRRADLLERLLLSIHTQTFMDYEVIIIDDASPNIADYTTVISKFRGWFNQFEYVRLSSNGGAPRARNEGIRRAKGEWLALVDDDDEWLPEKLEKQYAIAQETPPEVGLIYTWTRVVDGNGQMISESKPNIEGKSTRAIFTTNFIMSPSVMVRRVVFDKVGNFDEKLPSCQDWDMWARILTIYECRIVRQITSIYYQHGKNSVGLSPKAQNGYLLFLRKHWHAIMRYSYPLNWG
jgi:glycosyltransferase involved in cell wall biosynthesis